LVHLVGPFKPPTKPVTIASTRHTLLGPYGTWKQPKCSSLACTPWMMCEAFGSREDYYKLSLNHF